MLFVKYNEKTPTVQGSTFLLHNDAGEEVDYLVFGLSKNLNPLHNLEQAVPTYYNLPHRRGLCNALLLLRTARISNLKNALKVSVEMTMINFSVDAYFDLFY